MDLAERRDMNRGFGDGMSRAFELALTPMVVGGVGFLLDRWLGLVPLLTIVFSLWGLGVATYMTWLRYDREMQAHESQRRDAAAHRPGRPMRWARTGGAGAGDPDELRSAGA